MCIRDRSHVAHEYPVQMAAADAHSLGDIVDADVMGIVELDILDCVDDILGTGIGGMRFKVHCPVSYTHLRTKRSGSPAVSRRTSASASRAPCCSTG